MEDMSSIKISISADECGNGSEYESTLILIDCDVSMGQNKSMY